MPFVYFGMLANRSRWRDASVDPSLIALSYHLRASPTSEPMPRTPDWARTVPIKGQAKLKRGLRTTGNGRTFEQTSQPVEPWEVSDDSSMPSARPATVRVSTPNPSLTEMPRGSGSFANPFWRRRSVRCIQLQIIDPVSIDLVLRSGRKTPSRLTRLTQR